MKAGTFNKYPGIRFQISGGLKKKCHGFRAEAKQRARRRKFKPVSIFYLFIFCVCVLNVMGNVRIWKKTQTQLESRNSTSFDGCRTRRLIFSFNLIIWILLTLSLFIWFFFLSYIFWHRTHSTIFIINATGMSYLVFYSFIFLFPFCTFFSGSYF